jgi:hypothetical protein
VRLVFQCVIGVYPVDMAVPGRFTKFRVARDRDALGIPARPRMRPGSFLTPG